MLRSLLLAAFLTATCQAEEIPLGDIWAYQMPNTKDVRELEPKLPADTPLEDIVKLSTVQRIREFLCTRLPEGKKAGTAFVVEGIDKDALHKAHEVFVTRASKERRPKREPGVIVSPDTDLSLVFFSHYTGRYVRIESVDREDNRVTVKYRFVLHYTAEATDHFAIIPIGQFEEGVGRVKVEQLPPLDVDGNSVEPVVDPLRTVCDSFSFGVESSAVK